MCSPLERDAHFWKPTLSNRPSKIHFLEHWRLQIITHWAIFLALIAPKLFCSPLFRFSRPSEFWKIVGKCVIFAQGAVLQNDMILQFCNFLMVSAFCCLPLTATHSFLQKCCLSLHLFLYFYKIVLPARTGNTFLKANSEQSAFKHPLFGALKAWDKDSLGHLLDIYRSFARSVRLLSASVAHHNFDSRSFLVHLGPLKPDLQNDNTYQTCNFVTFWWLVPFAVCFWWLRTWLLQKYCMVLHFSYFYKNMLPARAGSTFLKPNSEQSAFKIAFLQPWRP